MTAIIDYDAGNLKSVEKALAFCGEPSVITRDPDELYRAKRVILPGVGSFGDAMEKLESFGLVQVIKNICDRNIPFLGICLGLQLLFEESQECPGVKGLSLLPGKILKFPEKPGMKIPHMGWNSLDIKPGSRLFANVADNSYVYFVHSYYLQASDPGMVAATTEYAAHVDAAVEKGNIFACQFHPEKSGQTGLQILKNFVSL